MDNSLAAADPNSNAFIQYLQQQQQQNNPLPHPHHNQQQQQQLQQQQQQQHQQHLQQQPQQQQQYHNHYQYHQHIPGSSYPLDYASLPPSSASAPPFHQNPIVPPAAALPFHHNPTLPPTSHGPTNPNSTQSNRTPLTAQHVHYQMSHPTAGATTQMPPLGVYNGGEAHPGGGGPVAAYYSQQQHQDSFYGWGGMDTQGSQWSQQSWDNCLPPGVDPPTTLPTTVPATLPTTHPTMFPTPPTPLPHILPHMLPHAQVFHHPHPYPYASAHQVFANNPWTARTAHMFWPRKRKARVDDRRATNTRAKVDEKTSTVRAKADDQKTPVVKTSTTKEMGSSESGLGWCPVCERDCVTEAALKQHLDGKKHKKQVERQRVMAEEAAAKKAAMEEGAGSEEDAVIQQMWVQVSMMEKRGKPKKKKNRERRRPPKSAVSMPSNPATAAEADANATPVDSKNATPVDSKNATPVDLNVSNTAPEADGDAAANAAPVDVNTTSSGGDSVVGADKDATGAVADKDAAGAITEVVAPIEPSTRPMRTKPGHASGMEKEEVWFRCELCNVGCNTQAVLEIHFTGKKHLNKLKKLQERPAGEQASLLAAE